MKKIITITAALALTASFAGAASAATETTETTSANSVSVSTTVTDSTYTSETSEENVLVKPGDGIDLPLLPLEITKTTYFYDAPNGDPLGALSSQFVSVTGNEITNQMTGDTWVEIYTWKGIAWVNTGN